MIPMLKQLEAYHIADILDPLEDRKYSGNWTQITSEIERLCSAIEILIDNLRAEIA